jgi:hypothetical protein
MRVLTYFDENVNSRVILLNILERRKNNTMDIFDKVKTKKSSDKLKKKTKKVKVSKKTEENGTTNENGTPQVVHDDGWADEAGEAEVEVVVAKLKTNLQMTNLADEKPEKDGNTDDWNSKDKKRRLRRGQQRQN